MTDAFVDDARGDDPLLGAPSSLDDWIGDRLPGRGHPLRIARLGEGSGIANALFLLRRGGAEWVLRRPPATRTHRTASDTSREWRILRALEGTEVPHPSPLLYCSDEEVLGAPFLIMEKVDGFTPAAGLPAAFDSDPVVQRELGRAYVDGLVVLSGVDWAARSLHGLGKPEGFLERQVSRWLGQLDGYRTRPLPEVDHLCRWLEDNRPPMSAPAILHGDYSPFNVLVAPAPPARLAAIVDWDTGTIGDPLLDLGHLLGRWTEPGEEPLVASPDAGRPHYPSREEMARRYGEATGRDLGALVYYEVLALFKLAAILEGRYAMERAAGVPDHRNSMVELVPRLLRGAAAFARGERR